MVSFKVLVMAVRGSTAWEQFTSWAHNTPIVTSGTKAHSPVHSLGEIQRFSRKFILISSREVSIIHNIGCSYPGSCLSISVIMKSSGSSIIVE